MPTSFQAKLVMTPPPGEKCLRYVGDSIRIRLELADGKPIPKDWAVRLRTTLGRAGVIRRGIIEAHSKSPPIPGAAWHDLAMHQAEQAAEREVVLIEVGFFQAKAYVIDTNGYQHWPEGADVGISVHPDDFRTGNTIYCAFPRLFGDSKTRQRNVDPDWEEHLGQLDDKGYTVIPASGKLRDLKQELPHIVETLECHILHLLPINPTPTTYARMGRFGSPYAALDMTAIDPALVEFDRYTTGLDQVNELLWEAHRLGAQVFLDLVVNHTGWGSYLQENHPDWFQQAPDGRFISPGAWGTTWHDLVELNHEASAPWEHLARVFLTWCERGVDGFRCDAGYKVPTSVWQYIIARVREYYPETLFLLEGLGGSWEATEELLTNGGMQWAYSELFQNYSPSEIAHYLDYSIHQSYRIGTYIHYSETHDNNRLAAQGKAWSLQRNQLCALTSVSGGFGFTCGVEWLADEKIDVHQCTGLAWNCPDNLVGELRRLNHLLRYHPCFFDGAALRRISRTDSPVYALERTSRDGQDTLVILINTDPDHAQPIRLNTDRLKSLGSSPVDLLEQALPERHDNDDGTTEIRLPPAATYCLASHWEPTGMAGDHYRRAKAVTAWALQAIHRFIPMEAIGPFDWRALAEKVEQSPARFLSATPHLESGETDTDLLGALNNAIEAVEFPRVVVWQWSNRNRITLIPPEHWLLIEDNFPFYAVIAHDDEQRPFETHRSIPIGDRHVAAFYFPARSHATEQSSDTSIIPGASASTDFRLTVSRYTTTEPTSITADLRLLKAAPTFRASFAPHELKDTSPLENPLALLTNGRGGMARMLIDLGAIKSKYDAVLGANLHSKMPVDRHVFVKRLRAWVKADGFVTPLNLSNLASFEATSSATWHFAASIGDGRTVPIRLEADFLDGENTVVLSFSRPTEPCPFGKTLPIDCPASLTVRLDIEDRNFHMETHFNAGADHHFSQHCHALKKRIGFGFTPAPDRHLHAYADTGEYFPEIEWCQGIPHPIEASRGQVPAGDAYSPGWFDLPLEPGTPNRLVITAESERPTEDRIADLIATRQQSRTAILQQAGTDESDSFGRQLAIAMQTFIARREPGRTVIAGYPWFLDWGRDTLICARGLLAGGWADTVKQVLMVFGEYEENGTLPNAIHATDLSNRSTSDAPLWYGLVCEELAQQLGPELMTMTVHDRRRTIADILREIATGYMNGTPNGICMDSASGLIWSPSHFTWMDTNFPAGTPREGYPVEIQVLWIRLLQLLARHEIPPTGEPWCTVAERAQESLLERFWLENEGYLADALLAGQRQPAAEAQPDHALRSNYLFAISLGLLEGPRARRAVQTALRHLVVPGALRSLAPLKVSPPLPIHSPDGQLLNDPEFPYWGHYEGDEDTRRKPAYHNGTAWAWTFPTFVEAFVKAYQSTPSAVAAGRAYLGSMDNLLHTGCIGQIPEIIDGDAPHTQRGCDAQAWSITEALRVWKWLQKPS